MASRGFPRFLFSYSPNAQDPGPFIISTLEPNVVCAVHFGMRENMPRQSDNAFIFGNYFALEILRPTPKKNTGDGYGSEIMKTLDAMEKWLNSQLRDKAIIVSNIAKSPEFHYTPSGSPYLQIEMPPLKKLL